MTGLGSGIRSSLGGRVLALGFLLLAFAGLCLNLYLFSWRVADGGIAGCGGGSCEQLLASRWAVIFGVPVTVFGALAYTGLMVSMATWGRRFTMPLLGAILGAVFWFIFVQAVLIGKFCPWCLGTHGVGLAVSLVGLIREGRLGGFRIPLKELVWWGVAAFLAIGLVQVYSPVPASHRIDNNQAPAAPSPIQARGEGRKIFFDDGRKSFDVSSLPRLGSPDAKRVMVEYFDFQCPSCRVMSGYLSALVEKHPSEICVLLMPVPLDPVCNEALVPGDTGHPGSCELTRIALAVWRVNPEAYPVLHHAFLSDPPLKLPDALALARKHVAGAQLDAAMSDPWIDELIEANVADWVSYSGKNKQLPKVLIRDKRILHGLPSGEADFIRVMEKELGL
jgi:uncharacterized membrane protein